MAEAEAVAAVVSARPTAARSSSATHTVIGTPEFIGGQPHIFWMIIPGKARFLKEFFDVGLAVTNLADEPFTFENGNATLQLPERPEPRADGQEQSLSVAHAGHTRGETSKATHWIIRGDQAGLSTRSRPSTRARCAPFDEPVAVHGPKREPDQGLGHERPPDHRRRGRPGVPDLPLPRA